MYLGNPWDRRGMHASRGVAAPIHVMSHSSSSWQQGYANPQSHQPRTSQPHAEHYDFHQESEEGYRFGDFTRSIVARGKEKRKGDGTSYRVRACRIMMI